MQYEAHSHKTEQNPKGTNAIKFMDGEWYQASEPVLNIMDKGFIKKGDTVEVTFNETDDIVFVKALRTDGFKSNLKNDDTRIQIMRQTAMKGVIELVAAEELPFTVKDMESFSEGLVNYYLTGKFPVPPDKDSEESKKWAEKGVKYERV